MDITVNASTPYKVLIGEKEADRLKKFVDEMKPQVKKILLFSDSNVFKTYGNSLMEKLPGYEITTFVFKAGEKRKNMRTIIKALNVMGQAGFTRNDLVIALGGGVSGDMAGFTAAIYMRGIRWINVPTTLLAMIDSSVGGKTGVDLKSGKNMAGAFYQPQLVICDNSYLKTLPEREWKNGIGEGIKYAILDGEILELELGIDDSNAARFVEKCIRIKKRIVEEDEKESGSRVFLNLGHTYAHAVEKLSHYKIPHGVAVGAGLRWILDVATTMEVMEEGPEDAKMVALLDKYEMPYIKFKKKKMIKAMWSDKKRKDDVIRLVIPSGFGNCGIIELDKKAVEDLL
ncbi:MAG: 3-dehydroquinate synthase [Christensenellales bacterium]